MISQNGLEVKPHNRNRSQQDIENAEQWAIEACDRIFSHYSAQELEELRKRNG